MSAKKDISVIVAHRKKLDGETSATSISAVLIHLAVQILTMLFTAENWTMAIMRYHYCREHQYMSNHNDYHYTKKATSTPRVIMDHAS